jgi:hypothetical protein
MQEKYGFVYIWRDKKHKRFYIGCHWGTEDDGYICSSVWMKNSYKRRPNDFRRKILKRIHSSRKELFESESYFLDKIKPEDFGKKYYNLRNNIKHWSQNYENCDAIKEKISLSQKGRQSRKWTQESKDKLSISLTGRKLSEETKSKLSSINKGNAIFAGKKHSEETKLKISKANSGKKYFSGKKHSEETKLKMSESAKARKTKEMPKTECPHCGKMGAINGLKRYHFNNCITGI